MLKLRKGFVWLLILIVFCFISGKLSYAGEKIEVQAKNFISTEYLSHNRIEQIKKTGILTGDGEATYSFAIPKTGWYEFYVQATQWPTSIYLDGKFMIYTPFESGVWKTKEPGNFKVMNLYLTKGVHKMMFSRLPFPGLPWMTKFSFVHSKNITGKVRLIFKKDYMVFKEGEKFPVTLIVGKSTHPETLILTITNVQSKTKIKEQLYFPADTETGNYQTHFNLPTSKQGVFDIEITTVQGKPCDREYQYVVIDTQRKNQSPQQLTKKLIYIIDASKQEPDYSNGATKVITTPFGSYRQSGDIGREKGPQNADWFGYKLHLPGIQQPYLLKIKYPDDEERTCEIPISEKYGADMPSLGYATGGIYPLSNKMDTMDFYFYPTQKDPRIAFYNWITGQTAAVSKIYVYRITSKFPILDTKNSNRLYGTYQEEPFRVVNWYGAMPTGNGWLNLLKPIERKCRLSAYSGINLWWPTIAVYQCMLWPGKTIPGYQIGILPTGPFTLNQPFKQDFMRLMLLESEKYNIKFIGELYIPPNWILAKYLDKKFGGTGHLKNNGYQKPWLVVSNQGEVAPGLSITSSPYFNPVYPGVQKWAESVIRELANRYKNIPSFAGLSIRYMPGWVFGGWQGWPDINWGYDDYTINLFEKETGIKIPVSNTDPQRFQKRYDWLMKHAYKKWINWRCEKMYQYYTKLARILTNARPDLKLYILFYPNVGNWIDNARECGINPKLYYKNSSIRILCNKTYPAGRILANNALSSAKYRDEYFNPLPIIDTSKPKDSGTIGFVHFDAESAEGPLIETKKLGYKSNLDDGSNLIYPAGVINPSGRNYLERFANAMADGNMVVINDGSHGYSLGQPEYLRQFMSEYHSLPDIGMNLLSGSGDPIALWYGKTGTKTYFYIVNRLYTDVNVSVSFAQKPLLLKRLSTDKNIDINGTTFTTKLPGYQMISYESSQQPISIKTEVPKQILILTKNQITFVEKIFTMLKNGADNIPEVLQLSPVEIIKDQKKLKEAKKEFAEGHLWETRNILMSKDMVKLYKAINAYPPSLFYKKFPPITQSVLTPDKIKNLVSLKDKKKIKIENGENISSLLAGRNVFLWAGKKIHLRINIPFSDFYQIKYSYLETKTYSAPFIYVNNKRIETKIPAWKNEKWGEKTIESVLLKKGITDIMFKKQKNAGLFFLDIEPIYKDINPDKFYVLGPFKPLKNPDNLQDVVSSLNQVLQPEKQINLKETYYVMNGKTDDWIKPQTGRDLSDPTAKNFIDFYKTFGILGNSISYAITYIKSPENRDAQLSFGADYWSKIWLNNKVIKKPEIRLPTPPQKGEEKINIRLKKGINVLLIKVYSGSAGYGFWCSISNPGDLKFMGKIKMKNCPSVELSNGIIKCKLYIPDAKNGYYRGSRFDWSGLIRKVIYKNHRFFGPWWPGTETRSPEANDQVVGPAGEFGMGTFNMPAPPGYNEAKIGGEFLKIGVGILKKSKLDIDPKTKKANYFFGRNYKIIEPIPWVIKHGKDWISFTQEVKNFKGYGYIYTHKIYLIKNKSEFIDQYTLKNIGKKEIYQTHYAHNFTSIDNQPVGTDYELTFPFNPQIVSPSDYMFVNGKKILFSKSLKTNAVFTVIKGFNTNKSTDNQVIIKNIKTGAGVKIKGNHPFIWCCFFATPKVVCPEFFVNIKIKPGETFKWKDSYKFFING